MKSENRYNELLLESRGIVQKAIEQYKPYKICLMISGGDDSLLTLEVCKRIGVKVDFIIHGNTRTGLKATTQFVRDLADAGSAYRDYVLRKGFFGKGVGAHSFSYHVLKAAPFRKAVSKHIRQKKRNRPVLLLNGVRVDESDNRSDKLGDNPYNVDPASRNNIWVNVVHWWTTEERDSFLSDHNIKRNPVAIALGRSGECMCGTMQNTAARLAASQFDPEWGAWLDELEKEAIALHSFGWGQQCSKKEVKENDFQPMCTGCKALSLKH
jgi:3'-phosphoadenosine 5'-phosphosulfate sulfotransferase (PAPS reductase)/FAD synthetase